MCELEIDRLGSMSVVPRFVCLVIYVILAFAEM